MDKLIIEILHFLIGDRPYNSNPQIRPASQPLKYSIPNAQTAPINNNAIIKKTSSGPITITGPHIKIKVQLPKLELKKTRSIRPGPLPTFENES